MCRPHRHQRVLPADHLHVRHWRASREGGWCDKLQRACMWNSSLSKHSLLCCFSGVVKTQCIMCNSPKRSAVQHAVSGVDETQCTVCSVPSGWMADPPAAADVLVHAASCRRPSASRSTSTGTTRLREMAGPALLRPRCGIVAVGLRCGRACAGWQLSHVVQPALVVECCVLGRMPLLHHHLRARCCMLVSSCAVGACIT